jgi:hypothetical protein
MKERGSVKMNTLSQCISSTAAAHEAHTLSSPRQADAEVVVSHSVPLASPSRLSSRRCCPSDPPVVASKSSLRRRCPGAPCRGSCRAAITEACTRLPRCSAYRRGVLSDEVLCNKSPLLSSPPPTSCTQAQSHPSLRCIVR